MEAAPTTEAVYQGVYALYNNPDNAEKEKASKWLDLLQKSVFSWSIADELLQQKRDLHTCYFAAQTMRNKIQNSFHELPPYSHESLRDSLVSHISQINSDTDPVIVTQLCLALADLALLMSAWQNPVLELIEKLSGNSTSIWPLLVILTLIPEEMDSHYLRLGSNRRTEVFQQLSQNSTTVSQFLDACLTGCNNNEQMVFKVIKCFSSWTAAHAIDARNVSNNNIVGQCFNLLNLHTTDIKLQDAATDCLCTVLQCWEDLSIVHQSVLEEPQLFNNVIQLENAYHLSVAHEDLERAMNYCRIFTVLGETFLSTILNNSDQTPHYAIKSLDLILNCVGHYEYEVTEITFNFWYRLSESLYHKNNESLTILFQPYIERLIGALYRHVQMDSDHEGLIEEYDGFSGFRRKASELIKDTVFIVGSSNCFKQMFLSLQEPNVTWESSEAALFVMENVAKNIMPDENEVVPKVAELILTNVNENTHIAIRYTSIMLIGELSEWIDKHPDVLQDVLNFLLFSLQQKNGLAAAAASALTSICTACRKHMLCHLNGLIKIAESLDSFQITNTAAIGLLKGISIITSRLSVEELTPTLKEICSFQLVPLRALIDSDIKVERNERSDPSFWVDRLGAILRHTNPDIRPDEHEHPCFTVLQDAWPIMSSIMNKYQQDLRIMERTCRCIRYALRCIGKQGAPLLDPLVRQMIHLYELHQHSCFLYLGSILVDEFANVSDQCNQGLLDMLQAFIQPTFELLKIENGLKNHPDTVDDFFRLCSRFIQRCATPFLQSPLVPPIIECALLACTLDHQDANLSVMKFFYNLLNCGKAENNDVKKHFVQQLVYVNGEALVMNLVHASVFCLYSYMLSDVADVLVELKAIDQESFNINLRKALDAIPKKNSGGCVTVTDAQLDDFYNAAVRSETPKGVTTALKEFSRLYR